MRPLVSAVGSVHEVIRRAGPRAQRDHWLSNPPMEFAGRVASLFRPLSPDRRGVAAVATLGTATALVLGVLFLGVPVSDSLGRTADETQRSAHESSERVATVVSP